MEVDAVRPNSQRDLERRYSPSKDVFTTGYTNAPLMSTTAIMNPVPQFATAKDSLPSGPPPPYRASAVPQSLSGLMSPPTSQSTDSRRTSDDTKEQNRLPSIAEAIGPQNAEPRSTAYSAAPAHGAYVQPYASSTTPGSQRFSQDPSVYSLHHESPQPRRSPPAPSVHSAANKYGLGSEPAGYSDGVRPPPLRMSASMQSPSHTSPYVRDLPPRQEVEPRYGAERMEHPSAYSATRDSYRGYPSAPPPAAAYHPIDRSYNRPQDRIDDYGPPKRLGPPNNYNGPYETTLKRNLDIWEVETNLEAVHASAKALSGMSLDALSHAQRYGRGGPNHENHPSLQRCDSMIQEVDRACSHLNMIRTALIEQEHYMAEQHHRRVIGKDRDYTSSDMDSWSSDQREMAMSEANAPHKRRGRAAPPGRCHSCNRAETPEWRRGPDGARTLCNACGLHYAKLTRKTAHLKNTSGASGAQPQGSSLRPKSIDES